jgi:hypothetical protein
LCRSKKEVFFFIIFISECCSVARFSSLQVKTHAKEARQLKNVAPPSEPVCDFSSRANCLLEPRKARRCAAARFLCYFSKTNRKKTRLLIGATKNLESVQKTLKKFSFSVIFEEISTLPFEFSESQLKNHLANFADGKTQKN